MPRPRQRKTSAFVLPAVLLFLALAFGMWAVLFRGSASAIRVEQARAQRGARSEWTAVAMAKGLRLLETGTPPTDPYLCKVTLAQGDETRVFLLTFEQVTPLRYDVHCAATTADDLAPDAPDTFAPEP